MHDINSYRAMAALQSGEDNISQLLITVSPLFLNHDIINIFFSRDILGTQFGNPFIKCTRY